jgi:alpha-mannosidase
LLNDCKYGYDVQGSTIRLSLLRAPKWPDRTADLGEHKFTYALYPHEGDWRTAHTVRHAAELNHEVTVQQVQQRTGTEVDSTATASPARPATGAWIDLDSEHVILDTVKMAEDGHGAILRFYESSGKRERVTLQWPQAFEQAYLSNALEEAGELLTSTDGQITLSFKPYEIKTVLLR